MSYKYQRYENESPEELIKVLAEFYPAERQKEFGVVGIEIKREE